VLAGVLIFGVIFFRMRGGSFDWGRFASTLYQVDWMWLTASMLLMLLTYLLRALRWEVMLRPSGRHPGIRRLTYDTAIGFTASALLGRVGEVVRPYLISVSAGVSFSSQVGGLAIGAHPRSPFDPAAFRFRTAPGLRQAFGRSAPSWSGS
jgi:glycosyltransferase 2 family protein